MHDMDKIMSEEYNQEYGFLNEGEFEYEGEGEWEEEYEGEWEGEFENEGEGEWEGEYGQEMFGEQMEYELAAELLAVSNEEELDQFFGKLVSGVKSIGRKAARFAKSSLGRSLIGGLKSVAKTVLPIAGGAAGSFFGGPVGGMIGGKLGSAASNLFEIQSEGMSNEDLEFEVARRVVRLASASTRNTLKNAAKGGSPKAIVTKSIKQAAAKYAPGLLTPVNAGGGTNGNGSTGQSGAWSRQGNQIILYGV